MSLRVKYVDVPQGAQEAAHVEGQGQPFSDMSLVAIGAENVAYATLEPDGWPLDGSRKTISADTQTGFWSASASDPDSGELDEPPVIKISFPEKYTATGITIFFSPNTEEWCTEICVFWYGDNELIAQETVFPTDSVWTIKRTVDGFDQITVELRKTNRYGHFAKVQKIEIGQVYWFDNDEISSVHVVNEVDPSLGELTVDTMQINIYDRQGRDLAPQKNQKMELYHNGNLYATQYTVSCKRQSKQYYAFSCQSIIGLLEDDYLGGIYNSVPILDVLADILGDVDFELHESFSDIAITGYLPICTRREALQQLVFSIGAVVITQGAGSIVIKPIPMEISEPFAKKDIFQGGEIETDPRIAKVEVIAHKYTESEEKETLIDAESIFGNDVLFTFMDPHHSYEIVGGNITGSGANWVTITANGEVTLIGKTYVHSTVRHSKRNTEATAAERNNVFSVEEATLVHSGNVYSVLQTLFDVSKLRQRLTQEVVVTSQRAGQRTLSENPYGESLQGYITSMESDFTPNGHTASVTILGVILGFDGFLYSGQLYSGDMEGLI